MRRGPTSLRVRLAGVLGLLFLGGVILLYLAAHSYARLAADRSYDRLLSGSALSIAETLTMVGGHADVDIPYAALDMLSAAPEDRVFYRVVGPGGTSVTGYDDLPRAVLPRRSGRDAALDEPIFFDAEYRGEPVRFVTLDREIAQSPRLGHVQVQVGQTLAVTLDALPGKTFEGKVFAVNPLVDTAGRSVVIRAIVRNPETSLRPGMFTRVKLITRDAKNALVVPEQAIVPQGDEQYVFRIVDGKVSRVKVDIGQRRDTKVEILKGLDANDVVVTAGQLKLRDGMPVTISNPNGPASAAMPPLRNNADSSESRAARS